MNKRIISTITILILAITISFAQEETQNTSYRFNGAKLNAAEYNPANTGLVNKYCGYLNYRKEWVGFDGAPEMLYGSVQGKFMNNMGIGINFNNKQTSIFKTFSSSVNYSYSLKLGNNIYLAPGIALGVKKNSIDKTKVSANQIDDPAYNSDTYSKTFITTGFGLHGKIENLSLGIALPEMYAADTKEFAQNIVANAAYDFAAGDFTLQPSVLFRKSVYYKNLIDVNFLIDYKNLVWAQAGYRSNTDFTFGFGVNFKMFGLAYGYDMTNSGLGVVSKGSHEIGLFVFIP